MSAGPSPPNPGGPRGNAHRPKPGMLAGRGPLLAAGLAIGLTGYLFFTKRPPQPDGTPSTTKLPGVKNIENAYSNAGATSTHTKAYGGTEMGKKDQEGLREDIPAGSNVKQGFKSGPYGDDQRSDDKTFVEKKFQKMNYGDEKGK